MVEPHDGSEIQPPSKPSYLTQPGGFFNTSTLVLADTLGSLFAVWKRNQNYLSVAECFLFLFFYQTLKVQLWPPLFTSSAT